MLFANNKQKIKLMLKKLHYTCPLKDGGFLLDEFYICDPNSTKQGKV
jgi:hypothetical protein